MMLPNSMTAIVAREPGGPEVLIPVERPVPEPGPGEVLIEVAAAGINRPDVLQRQGLVPQTCGPGAVGCTEYDEVALVRQEDPCGGRPSDPSCAAHDGVEHVSRLQAQQ